MAKKQPTWLDTTDADVREEILDTSAKMLARRATSAEIGRALATQFKVPAEARAAVLKAATARLVSWVGVPKGDPRFDSLALCESVVRSNASVRERMAAQQWIDELRAEAAAPPAADGEGGELAGLSNEQIEEQILKLRSEEAAG